MKSTWPLVMAILAIVLGLSLGSCSIFDEHEELCRREARLVIHDPALWAEYRKEAEETYLSRLKRFPNTRRVLAEYALNFEQRFGSDLKELPATIEGAVVREDMYIIQSGKPVAQFVNFYAREDFAGTTIQTCFGNFPELYAGALPVD